MSFLFRTFMRLGMYVFYIAVKPYSIYFSQSIVSEKLPQINNELLKVPGVKLADMIRNQVVECEVVIQAYIDRCKEVNPLLNAIVEGKTFFSHSLKLFHSTFDHFTQIASMKL